DDLRYVQTGQSRSGLVDGSTAVNGVLIVKRGENDGCDPRYEVHRVGGGGDELVGIAWRAAAGRRANPQARRTTAVPRDCGRGARRVFVQSLPGALSP